MKRRGGDGGRTMVFNAKDAAELMMEPITEIEDLCSKLMSLVPQDYHLNDSQGSLDLPSQLAQATTYIKDLQGRVEKLKQRRDNCYAKVLKSGRVNAANETALESCLLDVLVKSTRAAHFDVNVTMNSVKCIEMNKVIWAMEQDRCIEIIEASSCTVQDGKIVFIISCKATSTEVVLDAPMFATRLRMLFTG
ncbi:unnamed protein product [Urochloa humidicola]